MLALKEQYVVSHGHLYRKLFKNSGSIFSTRVEYRDGDFPFYLPHIIKIWMIEVAIQITNQKPGLDNLETHTLISDRQ